jgi:hypothetical protein
MIAKAKTPTRPAPGGGKSVTLVAPVREAREVVATGDFNSWSAEGVREDRPDGTWGGAAARARRVPVPPASGRSRWENNPAAERRAANAFGSENDILVVP